MILGGIKKPKNLEGQGEKSDAQNGTEDLELWRGNVTCSFTVFTALEFNSIVYNSPGHACAHSYFLPFWKICRKCKFFSFFAVVLFFIAFFIAFFIIAFFFITKHSTFFTQCLVLGWLLALFWWIYVTTFVKKNQLNKNAWCICTQVDHVRQMKWKWLIIGESLTKLCAFLLRLKAFEARKRVGDYAEYKF